MSTDTKIGGCARLIHGEATQGSIWQLQTVNEAGMWETVDRFETIAAAAHRISEIEGYQETGLFFEAVFDTYPGIANESFSHLQHDGRVTRRIYLLRPLHA